MKIAISGRYILPKMEGVGRYSREIITHLVTAHPEDEFHILLDRDYQPDWLRRLEVSIHIIYPHARHPILWHLWYEWSLPRILKKIKADVLFCPEGYLSKKIKIPTVMTVHDLAFKHYPAGTYPSHIRYLKRNTEAFIERADHLICVSAFTEQDLFRHYPVAKGKSTVIGHGVDHTFTPLSDTRKDAIKKELTDGIPYFLYLGSMHPRKNIIRLIEAFELYMTEGYEPRYLVLAGRLAWRSAGIRKKIEESSYADYIIYGSDLGMDIAALVGAAEALCYVSLLEGFGLPALEAMACGVPVVTSKYSAMVEVCGEAAIYANPKDTIEIKHSMVQLLHQPEAIKRQVRQGLEKAVTFRWAEAADRVYKVLLEVRKR